MAPDGPTGKKNHAPVVRDENGRVVSGVLNPKGGKPSPFKQTMRQALDEQTTDAQARAIAHTVLSAAIKGEAWACKLVWDSSIGKALEVAFTDESVGADDLAAAFSAARLTEDSEGVGANGSGRPNGGGGPDS